MASGLSLSAEPRRLGASGLQVGPIAYGCWRFAGTDVAAARRKVEAALDVGITLFDHADIYGGEGAAESLFGAVLREAPALRDRMVIATKCGIVPGMPYDSTPAHIRQACEESLRRLGVEVIDLYQLHRPDWLEHPRAVAEALTGLRESGLVREVGVSNFTAAQFAALQAHLPFPIVTHQPEFSAWCLDPLRDGVLDQCLQHGITPLAWSPFAGGLLGLSLGEARQDPNGDRLVALLTRLDTLAQHAGSSRPAVALAFLLAHPAGVVPIIGTQQVDRIRAAAHAYRVSLTRADWYAIVEASEGQALP